MPSLPVEHQQRRREAHEHDEQLFHYPHTHHSLYIISEHDYVRSLIPEAVEKEAAIRSSVKALSALGFEKDPSRPLPLRLRRPPRPLMATMTFATEGVGTAAPDSPPDLTNSKSSKSSSCHSSFLSDMMGPNDLSHFEDITLDDIQGRASISSLTSSRSAPHIHTFRDLTGGAKPRYPSLKGQVNNVVNRQQSSSVLNAPRGFRRGFTSPSAPSLPQAQPSHGRISRSPSPARSQVFSSAPRPLSRRSSRNLEVSPSPMSASSRRQSWQPHTVRKSTKEKEAECDVDDDDLPEDAVIWNVPMSPRPVQERPVAQSPPQPMPSPGLSPSPSATPQMRPPPSPKPSLPPRSPGLPDENTPIQPLSRMRTHSWQATFESLDPDAQALTSALEHYQSEIEADQSERAQKASSPQPTEEKSPVKASAVELPPLRKGDPLIDPLRVSKEKEKFLSRTRPSWLPPKNPKEEKKHLKEYQRIMAKIAEAESRELEARNVERAAKERNEIKKVSIFESKVLPDFERQVHGSGYLENRYLWWSGIPARLRGTVWQRAIGNELEVSGTTFEVALRKAKDRNEEARVEAIRESTKNVFPELKLFGPGMPSHEDLVDVCLAYTQYRHDIEDLGGFHHIAALLLLTMSRPSTFITLTNLLNRKIPLVFLLKDHSQIHNIHELTFKNLSIKLPTLHARFTNLRIEPSEFLDAWFGSLFAGMLNVEQAARVMDVYCVEGDRVLVRCAIAVLMALESRLYGESVQDILSVIGKDALKAGERYELGQTDQFILGSLHEAGKVGETGKSNGV